MLVFYKIIVSFVGMDNLTDNIYTAPHFDGMSVFNTSERYFRYVLGADYLQAKNGRIRVYPEQEDTANYYHDGKRQQGEIVYSRIKINWKTGQTKCYYTPSENYYFAAIITKLKSDFFRVLFIYRQDMPEKNMIYGYDYTKIKFSIVNDFVNFAKVAQLIAYGSTTTKADISANIAPFKLEK